VGRHRHDGARAVFHQHEVRDVDRHHITVQRVHRIAANEAALLLAVGGGAQETVLLFGLLHISLHFGVARGALHQFSYARMLRREHHEGNAKKRIGARGENLHVGKLRRLRVVHRHARRKFLRQQLEPNHRPLAAADPVALHGFHALGPIIKLVQIGEKLLGVISNLEKPLFEVLHLHGILAAPTGTLLHLLVGQHRVARHAPVDGCGLLVDQPAFHHFEEKPLVPVVIIGPTRHRFAIPIETETHHLKLGFHVVDAALGPLRRMHLVQDGSVFRRQAEGIEPHGVQHLLAVHAQETGQRVTDGIHAAVPHVKASAGIGEHFQHVVFIGTGRDGSGEGLLLLPMLLPARFNFGERVMNFGERRLRILRVIGHDGDGYTRTG